MPAPEEWRQGRRTVLGTGQYKRGSSAVVREARLNINENFWITAICIQHVSLNIRYSNLHLGTYEKSCLVHLVNGHFDQPLENGKICP